MILDVSRNHRAPEGLLQLPRVETGSEIFEVTVPADLQLSLIDLATPDAVPLAAAEVVDRPARGATGRLRIHVNWSFPVPLGRIGLRLRVYASADGRPPPIVTPITEPGVERRMRALMEQDSPFDLAVDGALAEMFHDQILQRGGEISPLARPQVAGVDDAAIVAIVAVSLAVIAAICIALGMATLGAVLFYAISKGYNIDDAGYNVAVGQGDSRQEHQMVFKIRQPGT